MRRSARIALYAAAAAVALAVLGALVLPRLIDPERYRELIEERVSKAVGREVRLGAVAMSVFPGIALRVDGVEIAGLPEEGSDDLLVADSLRVSAALLPLLRGRLEVDAAKVTGAEAQPGARPDRLVECRAHARGATWRGTRRRRRATRQRAGGNVPARHRSTRLRGRHRRDRGSVGLSRGRARPWPTRSRPRGPRVRRRLRRRPRHPLRFRPDVAPALGGCGRAARPGGRSVPAARPGDTRRPRVRSAGSAGATRRARPLRSRRTSGIDRRNSRGRWRATRACLAAR